MTDEINLIEYDGETPRKQKPCGTARITEKGFDIDAMRRYVVLCVDSPVEFFHGEHRVLYGAAEQLLDGRTVPAPMDDETENDLISQIASYYQAELVE